MKYYSTNHIALEVDLEDAVVQGLASDRGLFMPERIEPMPFSFFEEIGTMLSLIHISEPTRPY